MFARFLMRWNLVADGDPITTEYSRLLPVKMRDGTKAMLKIALVPEERYGAAIMSWWAGHGAARVYAQDGDALLMERAESGCSLADMAMDGRDDDASRVICAAAARLHNKAGDPPAGLIAIERRFDGLFRAARDNGGIFSETAVSAQELLQKQTERYVLHGDLHHGNVLDFGRRGWLAIDPKGIFGERSLEYCCLFGNPDSQFSLQPGRLARQAKIVADAADLELRRRNYPATRFTM
ncbi:aminoglycoside phosphotransferase family protein [Hoeflea sp.]|uniref:aminoglycoside phosphotransferase family protein n=1 Tax=Hoeflea sp. TaxID=1940281 RepID=UPI003B024321